MRGAGSRGRVVAAAAGTLGPGDAAGRMEPPEGAGPGGECGPSPQELRLSRSEPQPLLPGPLVCRARGPRRPSAARVTAAPGRARGSRARRARLRAPLHTAAALGRGRTDRVPAPWSSARPAPAAEPGVPLVGGPEFGPEALRAELWIGGPGDGAC